MIVIPTSQILSFIICSHRRMGNLSDDILLWKLLDPDQLRNKREASFHMN